jgi:uncharacterized protein
MEETAVKSLRRCAAALAAMLLAACGSSTAPEGGADAASGWSTLGTPAAASARSIAMTAQAGAQWTDYNPPAQYPGMVTLPNQFIVMADGTRLAASVSLPADADGKAATGAFPAVLIQTPYNKATGASQPLNGSPDLYMAQHGYAQVVVDVRGTGSSEGQFSFLGSAEQSDYYATVDWVSKQLWCNGSVGLFGASYLGITALLTAAEQHPAVKAAFPVVPAGDLYRDLIYMGGEPNLEFLPLPVMLIDSYGLLNTQLTTDPAEALPALLQHLESLVSFQLPLLTGILAGSPDVTDDGPFWQSRSPIDHASTIRVPTFIVDGLHDIFQRGAPLMYEALKHQTTAKLLIGPWTHYQAGDGVGLPADGVPVLDHIELQWFDQYVKGLDVGADRLPNVTQYVYGYGHYVTAADWPQPLAQAQRLFLHGDDSLSAQAPAAGEAPISIVQDPIQGICAQSTSQWIAGEIGALDLPCLTYDNSAETLEAKYDTAPLTQPMYINGPILVDAWISTTAQDANLIARVDDVDPNGQAFALTAGLQDAQARAVDATRTRTLDQVPIEPWHPYTYASRQPVVSGDVVEVQIEVFTTSALIQAGHRLRVAIGASDFPPSVPPLPDLFQSLIGVLSIHSDATTPSSVVLPVVPASALSPAI